MYSFPNMEQIFCSMSSSNFASWPARTWTSFHLSFDFFTPQIGVLYVLLQGINSPSSFKCSMISFNPSLTLGFSEYCFWWGNRWGSLSLITTGTAFCAQPTVFPLAHTLGFTLCSINGREREVSTLMKIKAWTLLSIIPPQKVWERLRTIRNSWEKSPESQLQLKGWLK